MSGLTEAEELELLELENENALAGKPSPKKSNFLGDLRSTIENGMAPVSNLEAIPRLPILPSEIVPAARSFANPLMSPVGRKLEELGSRVKTSAQGSVGNIVSSGAVGRFVPPVASATLGTLANTAIEIAPFTPQESSAALGGDAIPSLAVNAIEKTLPFLKSSAIMNRFLKTPLPIAKGRLESGNPTLGESFLEHPGMNPSDTVPVPPSFPSSDKATIYKITEKNISTLGKKVNEQIDILSGTPPYQNMTKIDKSSFGIRKNVINNIIDEMKKTVSDWDVTGKATKLLSKVKNSDVLDFKTSNEFRQYIGDYVGKRFEREEVPEKIEAMIKLFGSLRDKIGKISPKIDQMLKEQHLMFDIKNSVASGAARGYDQLPSSIIRMIETPFESPKVASTIKSLSETRGSGTIPLPLMKFLESKKYEKSR